MSKRIMVKMRKLDGNGKPFIHNGEEVYSEFDPIMADKILAMPKPFWEKVSETPVEAPMVSHDNPVPAEEEAPEEESASSEEEEAPKKKPGRPRKKS